VVVSVLKGTVLGAVYSAGWQSPVCCSLVSVGSRTPTPYGKVMRVAEIVMGAIPDRERHPAFSGVVQRFGEITFHSLIFGL